MAVSSFLNPSAVMHAAGLVEGQRVADFSGGAGFFARAAARAVGASGLAWFVDPSADILSRVKNLAIAEGLHNIEVVRGNIEQEGGTHLHAASVDMVLVANVLYSCTNRSGVAAEAARVLRRGGYALVVDWKDSFGGLGPAREHIIPEGAARTVFEQYGFTFVRTLHCGSYHWGCILQKKK